jgi:hypothetical protein
MVTPDVINEEDIAKLIIPDDLPNDEPSFKAYIEAKVYDKEGHLIQYHIQPMRSLTQYFLGLMAILIIGTYQNVSTYSPPDILTNVLGLPSSAGSPLYSAVIAWDWSIQLGSGTQAFSTTLNSLAAPIFNGTGVGQLSYSTVSVSYARTSIFVSVTVTNYTSSTISVTEIGLQGTIYIWTDYNSPTTYSFLLSYDTFSTAISVPAYGMAVFQITLSFTG